VIANERSQGLILETRNLPEMIKAQGQALPKRLGLELDVLPANLYLQYSRIFAAAQIVDLSPAIRSVRAVKSGYGLEMIGKACRRADAVAAHAGEVL
jgi:Xaa-Pro dipeptidase